MPNPFFTIVLPTFNRAHILPETISSVLNQSHTDWELLVIDDGSTDDTKKLITNEPDDRIKYIYQKNQERSAARNNGIDKASGKYVCFLDSDDLFEINHLQILHDNLSKRNFPIEFLFTNCYFLTQDALKKSNSPELKGESIPYLMQNPVIPARVCIHNSILKEFKFRIDVVIVEDTFLWVSIANKYPVTHVKEYTVRYRLHEDNSINVKNNSYASRLDGLIKLFKNPEIKQKTGKKLMKVTLSDCYFGIYRHYDYKKKRLKKIGTMLKAILKYPGVKFKIKFYLLLSSLPGTSILIRLRESKS